MSKLLCPVNSQDPYDTLPRSILFPRPIHQHITQQPPSVPQRAQFPISPQAPLPMNSAPPPQLSSMQGYGAASTSRITAAQVFTQLLRRLGPNEYVEVNLQAKGWVLGVVLATVELFDTICSWGYRIRFRPHGEDEQEAVFPHDPNRVRVFQERNPPPGFGRRF